MLGKATLPVFHAWNSSPPVWAVPELGTLFKFLSMLGTEHTDLATSAVVAILARKASNPALLNSSA